MPDTPEKDYKTAAQVEARAGDEARAGLAEALDLLEGWFDGVHPQNRSPNRETLAFLLKHGRLRADA